jgi:hypothetical protein
MKGVDAAEKLRVSVATYDQVLFPHPENGATMLALERKATVLEDGNISVLAQPFGGGVRIFDSTSVQKIIGEIQFDSERSQQEQDFRILIPPSKWEPVKRYCLRQFENPDDSELESTPDRELVEEFEEAFDVRLTPDQYTVQSMGIVIEDTPVQTKNWHARGWLTVRVYRIFKVQIHDDGVCQSILAASQVYSDQELGMVALEDFRNGGRGRANSVLALPLDLVKEAYLAIPPEKRFGMIVVDNHHLDESVLAVLGDVEVPQYRRV